jgi:TctA family transporter
MSTVFSICCKALRAASLSRSLWRLASAAASAAAAASALLRASSAAFASACIRALSVRKTAPQYTEVYLAYQPKSYQFLLTFSS